MVWATYLGELTLRVNLSKRAAGCRPLAGHGRMAMQVIHHADIWYAMVGWVRQVAWVWHGRVNNPTVCTGLGKPGSVWVRKWVTSMPQCG
jgi:hypothetical protein